ncbi:MULTISPECIES: hypothetical protein [Streptomyces]|uniref:Secreted protein n=1 Tax=Streptomyces viridochromogenes TaxID=1938 RepID=A0A0L8KD54_STRVR|nr:MULTISPECIES: hypothetical protein [Streptomyces]KOG23922.1 hypothetical protein ADK34_19450 [Streptomyces viridochromogenes]
MPSRRIRRAWVTAAAAASLAFTGLAAPAQAENAPQDAPDSTVQEPLATEAASSPFAATAWTSPGGAASPGDFTMSPGALNSETTTRVTRLDSVLPKSGVQNLLAGANRTVDPWCSRDPFGTAADPDIKYCLQSDDSTSREWVPQGFTGVSDAKDNELWGEAGNIQLFASYDGWDPGRETDPNPATGDCTAAELAADDACNQKGVRITFVQSRANPATGSPEIKYRHVLLGWTYVNSADHVSFDGLHAAEYPIQKGVHAGGIVWYGNYLYVADTRNGLRVFDMRYIMDLDPDGIPSTHDAMGSDTDGVKTTANVEDKTKVGRHDNVWYSFGYRYVMPQVAAWKFKATQSNPVGSYACVSTGAPKASYISLDRGTTPDRLLMGEYCRPASGYPSTGRIASFPVAALEGRSADVTAEGWANYLPLTNGGAQGAAAVGGTLYVNESKGTDEPGNLWRYRWSNGQLVQNGQAVKTARGAEDLYVERGTGRLWSLSEHRPGSAADCTSTRDASDPVGTDYCQRVLYGHKLSWLDGQP